MYYSPYIAFSNDIVYALHLFWYEVVKFIDVPLYRINPARIGVAIALFLIFTFLYSMPALVLLALLSPLREKNRQLYKQYKALKEGRGR